MVLIICQHMASNIFHLKAEYKPAGDQIQSIAALAKNLQAGKKNQVLMGVTGSGKTFVMANVIAQLNKPCLVMAHNKTLAAQLYEEFKGFFPENAVEYFVSYYDYYQPEAYIPQKDVYIEKDSQINERIDLLRHSATRSLLSRRDVIVVSSVSCIYGLGAPELYLQMSLKLQQKQKIKRQDIIRHLVELQYQRNDFAFERGAFRVRGESIDVFPAHLQDRAWRISLWDNEIDSIFEFDPMTGEKFLTHNEIIIFANSHYVTPRLTLEQAVKLIKEEVKERIAYYQSKNMLVEAQRIEQRTMFDLEMIIETGSCKGIENYSRYLSGKKAGEPPPTLFEYLPSDALLFIDESHVTVPQIGAMYNGDRARKSVLVEHGFRLPSALDNRPLQYTEWNIMRPQTVFVSATPGKTELEYTNSQYIEQIIRPTGLVDPVCVVKPAATQVDDLIAECKQCALQNERVLVTTLTKKMAENLHEYLNEVGIKAVYLHSDINTLERIEIIKDLRVGTYQVLVGVNLLREGLDIPECAMVAILDADKEGFLRSETSLIQTIGRAARNINGRVILYADIMTNSLNKALQETERRRNKQLAYNEEYGISPKSILKNIKHTITTETGNNKIELAAPEQLEKDIKKLRKEMLVAAKELDFEKAAKLRDQIHMLEEQEMRVS